MKIYNRFTLNLFTACQKNTVLPQEDFIFPAPFAIIVKCMMSRIRNQIEREVSRWIR